MKANTNNRMAAEVYFASGIHGQVSKREEVFNGEVYKDDVCVYSCNVIYLAHFWGRLQERH